MSLWTGALRRRSYPQGCGESLRAIRHPRHAVTMTATTDLHSLDADLISVCGTDDGGRLRARASAAARRGALLRLAHGVYIRPRDWLGAPAWTRHLYAALAYARANPQVVFCRETALALHGVPLLDTPREVHVRTPHRASVGRRRTASMGQSPHTAAAVLAEHQQLRTRSRPLNEADLRRPQIRRVLAPMTHPESPSTLGPGLQTEPVAFALVDTVPTMEIAAGVVALDGARSGRWGIHGTLDVGDLEPWIDAGTTQATRRRWHRAWEQSSPASESPGESLSRVLISEAGFVPPTLQQEITLPDGRRTRVDFHWREVKLIGEFDGAVKYARSYELSGEPPSRVVEAEKHREDGLRRMGFGFARWTWATLRRPAEFTALLDEAGVPRMRPTRRK